MSVPSGADIPVCLCLAKSSEAQATVEYLMATVPGIRIEDRDTFFRINVIGRIDIDLDGVEQRLGCDLPLSRFLVIMTSYVGRIELDDRRFSVCSEMLQLQDSVGRDS